MFTTSKLTRMTTLSAALLGVVIVSGALSSSATPALALGECGPNAHRGPFGGCRWGGQNQAGACEPRATSPLLVPTGRVGASGKELAVGAAHRVGGVEGVLDA